MGKIRTELLNHLCRPDLSVLGNAIKKLPPAHWKKNMFFAGVSDHDLREWTGRFPATFRKTHISHPVFVLCAFPSGPQVCPCSSRGSENMRYIRKNCRLEMKETTIDRNSFLVERFRFTIPLDVRFQMPPIFKGKVPSSCIKRHYRQNRRNENNQK